jgi:pilus assembly protein CpaF
VIGMEGDAIQMQDIFIFDREGVGDSGKIVGRFRPTGIRPSFLSKLKTSSHEVDASAFDFLTKM